MLFHSGPFHSAVNYSQFEQMGNVPEKPCSIYADPSKLRDVSLMDLLPHSETARTQIRVLYLLASLRGDTFDQTAMAWYPDPAAWPAAAKLAVTFDQIERTIRHRNATTRKAAPYIHLLPSEVAVAASV
jgi:arachidonate 15-lipoxygenase